MSAVVSTRVCSFRADPRGFVHATMHDGARFELRDAVECVNATFELVGRRRTSVLVDMRLVASQTREAREHFMCAETAEKLSGVALLVDSPVSRMLGNFFLRRSVHRIPTRLFTDEGEAVRWLDEHRA